MPTLILVRHGRSTANTAGILAGRTPGVRLDTTGEEQAASTAGRLAPVPLARLVTSPLERCQQTAGRILQHRTAASDSITGLTVDESLTECDYGDWQNQRLADLAKEQLWKVVTSQPSAAAFPGGESMVQMQQRAVASIRRHNEQVTADHGDQAVWAAVSHGDIIKSIIADAFGMPFDNFQRVYVDPASVTVIRYTALGPRVLAVNTTGGDLSWLVPNDASPTTSHDVQVGGGAGNSCTRTP